MSSTQVTPTANGIIELRCFSMTNHMVRQMKDYLPSGVTLKCFLFGSSMHWMIIPIFLFSLAASIIWIFSAVALCVVPIPFALTCHCVHVCRKSLPWLRLVPVIDGLTLLNSHIEVEVDHLEGVYLRAREAGLGQMVASSGKIKFPVMNPKMARYIARSRLISIVYFLFCLVALIITIVFLIANVLVVHYNKCISIMYCIFMR